MTGNKPRILVVEDNRETQLILKAILRNNFTLQFAESAEDAFNFFARNDYELILLDFNLKGSGNGRSFLTKVREEDKNSTIPVLVMSAYVLKPDDENFFNDNSDGFLTKPIDKKLLLHKIEGLLSKGQKIL